MRNVFAWVVAAALAAAAPASVVAKTTGQPAGWKAILIAGDNQEPAFDNAVDAMARKLEGFGVAPHDITTLKASAEGEGAATRDNILAAFAALDPGPRDGCFVYVTSHGMPGRGLVLAREKLIFQPSALARLLGNACGDRPSVVIASGCYSGIYVDDSPLPAPNRTILTAARADRPSFGCNAGLQYTFFDKCLLASLERGLSWRKVMDKTRVCVSGNEFDLRIRAPSEPQLSIGAKEADLRVFGR